MSSCVKNRHTSAMEKIIKNAVSESSKVLEKIIVELKAEILQVKSENENLKIRCSQFEAVVKRGTVYRETGTSPEPYIIDKCEKAVQCALFTEMTFHHPEDNNPNISDDESEHSSVPAYEKESSNDSFEFIQINDDEQNPCDSLDETIQETSFNQETNTNDDKPEDENMENKEISSCSSKEEIVATISSSLIGERKSCCKTYEMETKGTVVGDAENECAETDASLLKCQEAQKELKEVSIDQQEDINYPTENDDICKKSQLVECESIPLSDFSNDNVQEHVTQGTSEMDVEKDAHNELCSSELKSGNNSDNENSTGPEDHVDEVVSTGFSSDQDKPITPLKENASMDTHAAQEQSCTKIDTPAIQPMDLNLQGKQNIQETNANDDGPEHENEEMSSCSSKEIETTSLSSEIASMDTHAAQEQSCTKIDTPAIQPMDLDLQGKQNIQETNANDDGPEHENEEMSSCSSKEIETTSLSSEIASMDTDTAQEQSCTKNDTLDIQPLEDLPAKITPKTQTMNYPYFLRRQRCTSVTQEDAMLLLDSVNVPEYKTSRRTKTKSLSFETPKMSKTPRMMKALKEHPIHLKEDASTLLPQQIEEVQKESCINSMVMEDQPNDQEPSLTKPSPVVDVIDLTLDTNEASQSIETSHTCSFVTDVTAPNITPRKESKTSPSIGLVMANIDIEDQETTSTKPDEIVTQNVQFSKTPESVSVAAVLSALASSLAHKAKVKNVSLSTTGQGQETANIQKDTFSLIPHITMSPLKPQANSGEMGGDAQVDCHGTHDVVKFTSPIVISALQTQAGSRETGSNAQIDCPVTRDGEHQSKPFPLPSKAKPVRNPVIPSNLPLPKPGDTGDQRCSSRNLSTSRQRLSAAQLSAVMSAVRSSDGTGLSGGKKTVVVVPLQPVKKSKNTIIVVPRPGSLLDHPPQAIVEEVTTGELVQQQSLAVANTLEPPHTLPSPGNPQRRITVQVKLNRLSLPVVSAQTVSDANKSIFGSRAKQKRDSSGSASKISETATAQPVKDNLTRPVTRHTSITCDEGKTYSQVGRSKQRVDSPDQPITFVQFYPSVAADHSYPQLTMTKSQFLAQLHVSPVIQDGSSEKGVEKFSLVDRLRSHIKNHTKSTKKVQVASNPPVETDCVSNTNKTAGQNHERQTAYLQGISPETLPDTVAPVESNTSDDSRIQQVKRKMGTETDKTITKTVKKQKLRRCVMTRENTILQSNLRNKLINSNALLSCVRKGLSKNSFLCKFCQKEFPKKSEIEKHIQVHAGKKPFQCNLCRKRFCRTQELSNHLKKHDTEKKYQCTFCGKGFMEYNNLRRHLYIHTGEKPFGCPYCPRTFIQPGYLNLHVNKDHKDEVST